MAIWKRLQPVDITYNKPHLKESKENNSKKLQELKLHLAERIEHVLGESEHNKHGMLAQVTVFDPVLHIDPISIMYTE